MSKLTEKLTEYGADVENVMRRFVNDEALFIECLNDTLCDDAFNGLDEVLELRDVETAFMKTHSLKGMALNMGLTPFYNAVVNVVEDLRQGGSDKLPQLIDAFHVEKQKIESIYEEFSYLLQ